MADETEGQLNDEQPKNQQTELQTPRYTPRKVKGDGGLTNQTLLREDIARAMRDEMLVCTVDAFLDKLAPFSPKPQWIEKACVWLTEKGLLGTPEEIARPAAADPPGRRRSTRIADRARAYAEEVVEAVGAAPEVDADNANEIGWEAYRDDPARMVGTEMDVFRPLQEIVEALLECSDPSGDRTSNKYHYKNCPYEEMASEIMGANFKVDAVVANPSIYKNEEKKKGIAVAAAQTAVAMEFKKEATSEKVYENRKQLVSAANHIMNDDPRRNWMYGITIENTDMSLWYFSRSYSMKSAPFNFKTDYKKFIHVFLSFLYASDKELGHDPSIQRKYHDKKWCYVYTLPQGKSFKYYRTIEPLYNPRSYCIAGRKSRVWKVVGVTSPENLEACGSEVVLKDCWVDEGSLSETEIQSLIFQRLAGVEEAAYAWAPSELRHKLKHAIALPRMYFMKIELDWKRVGANKAKPESNRAPNLLLNPAERRTADRRKVIPSSQTSAGTIYPPSDIFNTPNVEPDTVGTTRDYKVKRHYRVVYAHVGKSLAHVTELSDAVKAIDDIFIALTLLFLARWVHRDVSEGNIILVRDQHGVSAKLSDLEYARDFDQTNSSGSSDPKTGTAYFMPLEIHSENFIFPKLPQDPDISAMDSDENQILLESQSIPRYTFAHDMESLWWVIVWIILQRVKGSTPLNLNLFVVCQSPHEDRRRFFTATAHNAQYLSGLIHASLKSRRTHTFLAFYNQWLLKSYEAAKPYDGNLYKRLWELMGKWVNAMRDVALELTDLSESDSTDDQELGKRPRSTDDTEDSAADRRDSVEGPPERKKQKASEDGADADTIQDMAGIVREEWNPRIHDTWLS